MIQLNAKTLSSVNTARGVKPATERVIQFGEGGFLRAFCDWMIDKANEAAGMDAGVVIVQPIERGMIGMLNEQDGLYTQILRGVVDGKAQKDTRIIQCVSRGLSPYEDFEGYLALAALQFAVQKLTLLAQRSIDDDLEALSELDAQIDKQLNKL